MQIKNWVAVHRVHHKFTDTESDPHNVKRGFFFSHIGWTLIKRPRHIIDKMKLLDMSDVYSDSVITFCDK